jgi:hypothetical protein
VSIRVLPQHKRRIQNGMTMIFLTVNHSGTFPESIQSSRALGLWSAASKYES